MAVVTAVAVVVIVIYALLLTNHFILVLNDSANGKLNESGKFLIYDTSLTSKMAFCFRFFPQKKTTTRIVFYELFV